MDSSLLAAGALGRLGADGHVLVERARRDDDAGGVNPGVARETFELHRVVEELAVPLLLLPDFARIVLPRRVELAHFRNPLDRFLDREREVGMVRNQLGEIIGLGRSEAEGSAHILDGRAGFQGSEGDDLADRIASVLLPDVLDDFAAPLEAEVDVDVGHRHALRVEEALEQQIELERADIGDAERVGDERAGRGSAAWTDRNPLVARGPDEVGDDEEVAGVSGLGNDAKLVVEPLTNVGGERGAVTLDSSFFGQAHQQLVLRLDSRGEGKGRDLVLLREGDGGLIRDAQRILQDILASGEPLGDLGRALEVEALVVVHPVGVGEILAQADAEENVVGVVIVARKEVRVVGGEDGEIQLRGELEDAAVESRLVLGVVRLHLEVVPIAKDVGVPRSRRASLIVLVGEEVVRDLAGHAGGGDDDAFAVFGEELAVHPRLGVESLRVGEG